jgi:hypothetical protein
MGSVCYYYYYYLFTAIGFAPGGSGPYTTQLQQKTYNINNKKHTCMIILNNDARR